MPIKKRTNKIVMAVPEFGDWLLQICKEIKVELKDYYLPKNETQLYKEINYHLPKLEKLIEHLKSIGTPAILFLEKE